MNSKSSCFTGISVFGIVLSVYLILISTLIEARLVMVALAALNFFLNIALFKSSSRFVRICILILACIWVLFLLVVVAAWVSSNYHYAWGIALVAYSPALLWSVLVFVKYKSLVLRGYKA